MRVLFMGTPDFARYALEALCKRTENEISVITQPDKPKGRKYVLTPSEVKVYALEQGLPVYQPQTLKDEAFDGLLKELDPEIIIVAAYGKILPKSVIDYPKYGCINIHGSLLPKYRGAAPIQRAIIDGDHKTGITIMYMNEGLDTGDMLAKQNVDIEVNDDFGTVFEKMANCGAELLLSTLPKIINGEIVPEKQDGSCATYASKIEKDDCKLDFSRTDIEVHNRVRGLSPFPLAYAIRNDVPLKIVKTALTSRIENKKEGSLVSDGKRLYVVCKDGHCLEILEVLPAGKKRMSAMDYLRGNALNGDETLVTPE